MKYGKETSKEKKSNRLKKTRLDFYDRNTCDKEKVLKKMWKRFCKKKMEKDN